MTQEAAEREEGGAQQGLWAMVAEATDQASPAEADVDVWNILAERLDFSRKKPRRISDAEVALQRTAQGREYYVLHNPQANTYLKIDPPDHFLWERLDGEHSIRDLAVAYFGRYRSFPFERLSHLVAQLKAQRLLDEKSVRVFGAVADHFSAQSLAYRLQRFAATSTQKEFNLKNVDSFFSRLYRQVGWPFFTRPAVIALGVLSLVGLMLFGRMLAAGTYPLMSTAGSYGLGLVVLVLSSYVMAFIHECGHALACKSYGRKVPKGGLLLYYGSPAWFVDTTDIWMAPKRARLVVSCAGPAADMIVGSLLVMVAALWPAGVLSPVLFQAAFMGYVSVLVNLNPLMEFDGYFLLMDWLEIPLLRKKSLTFVRRALWSKLFKERTKFSREERIYTVYGILAAIFTGGSVGLVVYLWQSQVVIMFQQIFGGGDVLSAILLGGLMVAAGAPLAVGLAIKAIVLASEGVRRLRAWVGVVH